MRVILNTVNHLVLILGIIIFAGCGGSAPEKNKIKPVKQETVTTGLSIPNNRNVDSFNLLFIGNSHVISNDLAGVTKQLIELGTNKSTNTGLSSSQKYLDERVGDGITEEIIVSERWTHIIFQAQKYSQSRSFLYPTVAAELWASLSKTKGATPIFFPEHPQKDNTWEGQYIYDIHKNIADNEMSCVAPIGPAWDLALQINNRLPLHNSDGNHAELTGTFLSALVFYQVVTGLPAEELPYIDSINVPEDTQRLLRETATDTIAKLGDCNF